MTLFQVFFGEFPRIFLKILFKEALRMTSSLPVRIRDDRSKCLIFTYIQIAGSTQLYWNLFPLTECQQLLICFFLVFRKPTDLKIGVWLSAECFDILYSSGQWNHVDWNWWCDIRCSRIGLVKFKWFTIWSFTNNRDSFGLLWQVG